MISIKPPTSQGMQGDRFFLQCLLCLLDLAVLCFVVLLLNYIVIICCLFVLFVSVWFLLAVCFSSFGSGWIPLGSTMMHQPIIHSFKARSFSQQAGIMESSFLKRNR